LFSLSFTPFFLSYFLSFLLLFFFLVFFLVFFLFRFTLRTVSTRIPDRNEDHVPRECAVAMRRLIDRSPIALVAASAHEAPSASVDDDGGGAVGAAARGNAVGPAVDAVGAAARGNAVGPAVDAVGKTAIAIEYVVKYLWCFPWCKACTCALHTTPPLARLSLLPLSSSGCHAHAHALALAYTYTHAHARTHTHTHTQVCLVLVGEKGILRGSMVRLWRWVYRVSVSVICSRARY
jgi:hypothetical protein